MTEFTPGPWDAFLLVDEAEVIAPKSRDTRIADVFCGSSFTGKGQYDISQRECHANAHLIAAAPAMYEKHERIAHLAEYYSLSGASVPELMGQLSRIFNEAQAALALADGDQE
jgi:hypothetical protein